MIKFENLDIVGWEAAIRGMRNPHNSWEKSDSVFIESELDDWPHNKIVTLDKIGPNDHERMLSLSKAGTDHRKYLRMIVVYVDIIAPLYWWKEFDTYKVGTVANSCSTMHKLADKEFTLEDFSYEHLGVIIPRELNEGEEVFQNLWVTSLEKTVSDLNIARGYFLRETNPSLKKKYWWQMIQLLPSSYNQRRTIMLNYEVLANIYKSRRGHKLDEWCEFCEWIEGLPYSELIIERE